MKKFIGIIIVVMLLGMTACGLNEVQSNRNKDSGQSGANTELELTVKNDKEKSGDDTDSTDSKILVVYFSRSGENWKVGTVEKGSTQLAAEYIAEKLVADIYRIEPVEPYAVSYIETLKVAKEEQASNSRPEIKTPVENWEQYDTIYLGYPIWDGDMPMIVYSFLESQDFSGKTIYPFDTHAGSGLSGTVSSIQKEVNGANVKYGLEIKGETVQKDFDRAIQSIDEWLGK